MILSFLLISKISAVKFLVPNLFTLHRNSQVGVHLPHFFFLLFFFYFDSQTKTKQTKQNASCIVCLLQLPCFSVLRLSGWSISRLLGNRSNVKPRDNVSILVHLLSTAASTSGLAAWGIPQDNPLPPWSELNLPGKNFPWFLVQWYKLSDKWIRKRILTVSECRIQDVLSSFPGICL